MKCAAMIAAVFTRLAATAHASPKADICKAWGSKDADHTAILNRLTHSKHDDYSRYDEDIPGAFCEGKTSLVDQWIDQGYFRERDALRCHRCGVHAGVNAMVNRVTMAFLTVHISINGCPL